MHSVLESSTRPRTDRRVFAIALALAGGSLAQAGDARFDVKSSGVWKKIIAGQAFVPGKGGKAGITVRANFDPFHPVYDSGDLTPAMKYVQKYKDANGNDAEKFGVSPATYGIDYPQPENHASTGRVDWKFALNKKNNAYFLDVDAMGTVKPKPGTNDVIAVTASAKDPFSFSDTDPSAMFGAEPGGITHTLALRAGTSLANVYTSDGAVASGTSITIAGRARLGVYDNGGDFWAGSDGVDLYTLKLTPDPSSSDIHAELTFEAPTSDFTLAYRDHLGNVFDPTNSSDVDAIETYVATAFSGGTLTSDLETILDVDIVPTWGSDFSAGQEVDGAAAGIEPVPEPASVAALATGALTLLARRRRLQR